MISQSHINCINNYYFLEFLNHFYTWPLLAKSIDGILLLALTFPNDMRSVLSSKLIPKQCRGPIPRYLTGHVKPPQF